MAKFWELLEVHSAEGNYFEAELFEQPVLCYLAGRVAYAAWELIGPPMERWLPWWGRRTRFNVDETVSLGWQVQYELWSSWDAQRWQRVLVERVRVADRGPDWWKPYRRFSWPRRNLSSVVASAPPAP